MSFEGLHETVIADIVDTIRDGITQADNIGFAIKGSGSSRLGSSSSLSKATEGLVLVFPHLCSENVSPETAGMLTKAIETKAVSILQIAFSAFSITNSDDAVSFVRQFHTNIGSGKMSIDKFIDAMDSIPTSESSTMVGGVDRRLVRSVLEEFKQMECYFEEDLSESSINDFRVVNRYGNYYVTEAKRGNNKKDFDDVKGMMAAMHSSNRKGFDNLGKQINSIGASNAANSQADREMRQQMHDDDMENKRKDREAQNKRHAQDLALKQDDIAHKQFKDDFDMLKQQLMPSDIKKANEMVPSMMIINFITRDEQLQTPIRSQAVIGVKAKLYPVSSDDVINKIILKNADTNVFLKLMRVSTRELNFVKDFLLAIDDAKLAAISCSTKGSDTNRLLKMLERRALKGKVRSRLNMKNAYKAITTLTITKEEADFIKKYNNIDVYNPAVIRKIMETLNLMMFIIADDAAECSYIIMDTGEDMYEKISYTHLERESTDGSYKKAINLMTKVVR